MTGANWTFAMLGVDGQWHEVPGIASVELHQEQPDDGPPDDEYWRRHDSLDALAYSMGAFPLSGTLTTTFTARTDRFDEAFASAEEALRGLAAHSPRVIDQDGNPVRPRPDRPAWQSQYGPARRRR